MSNKQLVPLFTSGQELLNILTYCQTNKTILPPIERFSNDCRQSNTKVITPTNHNKSERRDEPIRIQRNYCNLLKARGKSRVQGAIFGFASHSLKNWREIF